MRDELKDSPGGFLVLLILHPLSLILCGSLRAASSRREKHPIIGYPPTGE